MDFIGKNFPRPASRPPRSAVEQQVFFHALHLFDFLVGSDAQAGEFLMIGIVRFKDGNSAGFKRGCAGYGARPTSLPVGEL